MYKKKRKEHTAQGVVVELRHPSPKAHIVPEQKEAKQQPKSSLMQIRTLEQKELVNLLILAPCKLKLTLGLCRFITTLIIPWYWGCTGVDHTASTWLRCTGLVYQEYFIIYTIIE
jgi:hypothetical protein